MALCWGKILTLKLFTYRNLRNFKFCISCGIPPVKLFDSKSLKGLILIFLNRKIEHKLTISTILVQLRYQAVQTQRYYFGPNL